MRLKLIVLSLLSCLCLFGCDLSADDINQIIDNIDNIEIGINEDKDKEVEPEILTPPEPTNPVNEDLIIISSDNKETNQSFLISNYEELEQGTHESLGEVYNNYKESSNNHVGEILTCIGNEDVCKEIIEQVEKAIPDDLEKILSNSIDGFTIVTGNHDDFKSHMKGTVIDNRVISLELPDYSGICGYDDRGIEVFAEDDVETVVHELGHALDFTYYKLGYTSISSRIEWKDLHKTEYVSDYAKINEQEYFAETFMYYFTNQMDKLTQAPNTVSELENLIYFINDDESVDSSEIDIPEIVDDKEIEDNYDEEIDVIDNSDEEDTTEITNDTEDEEDWYVDDSGDELQGIPSDYEREYEKDDENNYIDNQDTFVSKDVVWDSIPTFRKELKKM